MLLYVSSIIIGDTRYTENLGFRPMDSDLFSINSVVISWILTFCTDTSPKPLDFDPPRPSSSSPLVISDVILSIKRSEDEFRIISRANLVPIVCSNPCFSSPSSDLAFDGDEKVLSVSL